MAVEKVFFQELKIGNEIYLEGYVTLYKVMDLIYDGKEIASVKVKNLTTGDDRYIDNLPSNILFKKNAN